MRWSFRHFPTEELHLAVQAVTATVVGASIGYILSSPIASEPDKLMHAMTGAIAAATLYAAHRVRHRTLFAAVAVFCLAALTYALFLPFFTGIRE